jgi:hypothetical protein
MNIVTAALIGTSFVGVALGSTFSSFRFFDNWQARRDEEKLRAPSASYEEGNLLIECFRSKQPIISPVETHECFGWCTNCHKYNGIQVESKWERQADIVVKSTPRLVDWQCYNCNTDNKLKNRPISVWV